MKTQAEKNDAVVRSLIAAFCRGIRGDSPPPKLEATIAARAKVKQVISGKDYGKGLQKSAEPIKPIDTRRELAKIAGVSHG